jgi:hypothetical protein
MVVDLGGGAFRMWSLGVRGQCVERLDSAVEAWRWVGL